MQKENKSIKYFRIIAVLTFIMLIIWATYSTIRTYDNFVAEQQKIGFDKGYAEAIKEVKTTNSESN